MKKGIFLYKSSADTVSLFLWSSSRKETQLIRSCCLTSKGQRQTKFTHYHFLQLYKHWCSPGIAKMLQHCETCILLPKLHVKLKRLWTNSPVLQHLYWRSVPCVQLCNVWILQLSSEAISNNIINTSTFNASHWILEWATSSFTFSSQKVLSKSLYCCFPLKQPW